MYVGKAEKSLVEKSLLAESTSEMDVIESNDDGNEWKRSQVAELVEIVKNLLPKDDTLSYTRRMKGIKWDRVSARKGFVWFSKLIMSPPLSVP